MNFVNKTFDIFIKKGKLSPDFGIGFFKTDAQNGEIGGFVNVWIRVHKATANLRLYIE
ncbi:hypothetical protein SDC9_144092 [bioreactor metagenome]|uniref:Uncharacterized protein n=1 Tax=bioreactor metagenome TaxID=1076179 RepID=A0A645E805_9ZZZZ